MIADLGFIAVNATIRIPFSTFDANGASLTMTNFAVADILIYKDGSTTERASTSGYTATTDFDGKTGRHLVVIDLSDNTTAGFFAAGSEYLVMIDSVTVNAQTVGFWIARFVIGVQAANATQILGTAVSTPATAGILDVNVKNIDNDAASASGTVTFPNATLASTTGAVGSVTGAVGSVTGAVGSVTGNVGGNVTGTVGSVVGAVGSVTGNVGGNVVGTVASVVGAVASVTGNVGGNVTGSVGSLGATAKTDVKLQVTDALNVDTYAQIGQGAPPATTTLRLMIAYLYKAFRNKTTQDASQYSLYNDDAATVDQKAAVSDDGTTFTRGEVASGP